MLIIAVAVSCASAALVPWGGEVAAQGAPQTNAAPGVRPVLAGPMSRAVTKTGSDPLAVIAATAYRSLALSALMGSEVVPLGFANLRHELAHGVAARIDVDAVELLAAWSGASVERQLALLAGLSQLGVPYRANGSRPGVGLDCSGLTSFAWSMVGEQLPRNSRAQIRSSEKVKPHEVQPGDLVFYPGHVMLSLGIPGAVLHSPEPGRRVMVRKVPEQRSRRWVYGSPIA